MLRSNYLKGRISQPEEFLPLIVEPSSDSKEENPLIKFIFEPDSNGILKGDLKHYLNNQTNPEVRQFIEMQLMQDKRTGSNPLGISDEVVDRMRSVISDDDIAFFSRNADETVEQYSGRIGNYFAKQRSEAVAQRYYAKEKKRLSDLGYDFD